MGAGASAVQTELPEVRAAGPSAGDRRVVEYSREIAAVDGIGVLWPGAGTLRQLFSTQNAQGERVTDEAAWENAIQQVLAACKEFDVPCGFPATTNDIEMRMEQGFSVFVMAWGENGFATIDMGKRAARD